MASIKIPPVVPGHEVAGVISEVGEGVTDWKVGDRVATYPLTANDGAIGYMINGGWEERAELPADCLVAIPEGVDFNMAAAATDASMTSSGAVFGVGGVAAGMKVGIIGYGGLSQIGARLAHLEGAEVYVAEIKEDVWEEAKAVGATKVAKDITEFKDDQLDVIVDFAGFGTTTAAAIETVRFGGKVVQVGMGCLESTINTYALILGKVTLAGSMGGTKDYIAKVMKWMFSGDLTPNIEQIDFEQIAEGVQRLHDGKVNGRLVARVAD